MTKTSSQRCNADITALLKARNTLLWVVTREEVRVEAALTEAAGVGSYPVRLWDCATGITSGGAVLDEQAGDPAAVCARIRGDKTRAVYVLRDLHKWLADPVVCRQVRSLARSLQAAPRGEARAMVVLTPSSEVPPELSGHATVIEYPLPERTEIEAILSDVLDALPEGLKEDACAANGTRERAVEAALGLLAEEAASCYAKSIVLTKGKIDPAIVAAEKRRVINAVPGVEWHDPDPRGLEAVGGLDLLKPYLVERAAAFSARAREFGLPCPRGSLLVGVPGCGKSLTAKAVATAWQVPLLRLDLGALRSKWIGESEGNIRRALGVAETIGRCVLWLDEIEKALAGSTGEAGDGGVAKDALGTILTWMQESGSGVYVIATANDVSALPPELLRRFDAVWFVDLPTGGERAEIVRTAMCAHRRDPDSVDPTEVAQATEGFTGAEVAGLVVEALYSAFADGERDIRTEDLTRAAAAVVPLSQTAGDKIAAVRAWAKGRARPASRQVSEGDGARGIEL